MEEHLHHPEYEKRQQHPDKQDEISGALKEDAETMNRDIGYFQTLMQWYYETTGSVDYEECTGEEIQVGHDAHLYTLITYNSKDVLVQVGSGEYNTAVFTKAKVEETRWLRNSPLPLFVVTARADQEQKMSHPRQFLNEHAMIYSPKGGQAEMRITFNERKKAIDYGKSNGIMKYEDAVVKLQTVAAQKMFYDRKTKHKLQKEFIDKMKYLQSKDFEQFIRRYEVKTEFYSHDKRDIVFRDFIAHIGQGNLSNTYKIIQRFNPQSGTFTPLNH